MKDKLKKYLKKKNIEFDIDLSHIEEDKLELNILDKANAYLIYFEEFNKCFSDFENKDVQSMLDYHKILYTQAYSLVNNINSGSIGYRFQLQKLLNARVLEINEFIDLCRQLKEKESENEINKILNDLNKDGKE